VTGFDLERALAERPAILAPMEDVTDAAFRAVCRARGATLAVTEFVHERALRECMPGAVEKVRLGPGDAPTAIQIYGADPEGLEEAASIAEAAGPAWIDLNCGCWVPKVARGGAGAAWLRDPDAMVARSACPSWISRGACKTRAPGRSPCTAAPPRWATKVRPTGAGPRTSAALWPSR
jgi:hypothetical protein